MGSHNSYNSSYIVAQDGFMKRIATSSSYVWVDGWASVLF